MGNGYPLSSKVCLRTGNIVSSSTKTLNEVSLKVLGVYLTTPDVTRVRSPVRTTEKERKTERERVTSADEGLLCRVYFADCSGPESVTKPLPVGPIFSWDRIDTGLYYLKCKSVRSRSHFQVTRPDSSLTLRRTPSTPDSLTDTNAPPPKPSTSHSKSQRENLRGEGVVNSETPRHTVIRC